MIPLATQEYPIAWPRWARYTFVGLAMLILCSCRGVPRSDQADLPGVNTAPATAASSNDDADTESDVVPVSHHEPVSAETSDDLAELAVASDASASVVMAPEAESTSSHSLPERGPERGSSRSDLAAAEVTQVAHFEHPHSPAPARVYNSIEFAEYGPPSAQWRPPGIRGPWPHDEYLRDGGDFGLPAGVRPDWTVVGLEQEDAVGHYDTLDGRTIVQPTNRVHLYAPRFGVVRRVDDVWAHQQHKSADAFGREQQLVQSEDLSIATTTLQRLQAQRGRMARRGGAYRARQMSGGLESQRILTELSGPLRPNEDFQIMRFGIFAEEETALLEEAVQAAITWSQVEQVHVLIDEVSAVGVTNDVAAGTIYHLTEPDNPQLRVIKTASKHTAQVGELVDFAIRYDNVGDQAVGNVTILDNLSTRLEYVPDSAQSSAEAQFHVEENVGGSLVLRWDILEPLEPGEGGLVRFRCRVR